MDKIWIGILLLGLGFVGLCVRIILKKNGRFSSKDIGQSEAMHKRGIYCIRTQDVEMRRPKKNKIDVKSL
ncbi:MAG: hypothetical protein MJZ58_04045 [Paludibacteraceae bacterium]|nr:hypothetical protein [Paludibacteraceae bacterium]